jgi:predicted alpha/beta superfamily hydrolase
VICLQCPGNAFVIVTWGSDGCFSFYFIRGIAHNHVDAGGAKRGDIQGWLIDMRMRSAMIAASKEQTYPVLYIPNGEYAFPVAVGLIPTMMGSGKVPEMLVVEISYRGLNVWGEFGVLRDRDFCTQSFQAPPHETRHTQYRRFFQDELFPLIETYHRASPQDRALFGFSSAGFFTLHMLSTQPGMFRRHVAASCTWPGAGEYFLQCAKQYAQGPPPATSLSLPGVGRPR